MTYGWPLPSRSKQPRIPADIHDLRNTDPIEICVTRVEEHIPPPGLCDMGGDFEGQGSLRFDPVAPNVPGSRAVGPIREVGLIKDLHAAAFREDDAGRHVSTWNATRLHVCEDFEEHGFVGGRSVDDGYSARIPSPASCTGSEPAEGIEATFVDSIDIQGTCPIREGRSGGPTDTASAITAATRSTTSLSSLFSRSRLCRVAREMILFTKSDGLGTPNRFNSACRTFTAPTGRPVSAAWRSRSSWIGSP